MSNPDAEKAALENATKNLDLTSKLQQSKQNLAKALGDLAVSGLQIGLDNITRQLDARKRLETEDPFSMSFGGEGCFRIATTI